MVSEIWSFNEKIYKTLFNNINDLRKNKILCDVVLKVDNQEFYAHRIILASCSDYFMAMFTNEVIFRIESIFFFSHNQSKLYLDA
jgi:hypothetical protein